MKSPYRYLILVAGVLMQACLGATYSWSTFVGLIKAANGIEQSYAQLPFTVFYIAFPLTMVASGFFLRKLGPRGCSIIGGIIFGGGWMAASLGKYNFLYTIAGIGALGGIGVGFGYIVPIAVGMLWFPQHKGLVTGLAVAGFGGGAALVSCVGEHLTAGGMTPFNVFRLLGLAYAVIIVVAGLIMRYPPGYTGKAIQRVAASKILPDRAFQLLYVAMFAGLAAGLTVIPNLRQLCPPDKRTALLAAAIPTIAIGNAVGRVSWGFIFDRLLQTGAIRVNLLSQAVALFVSPWLVRTPQGLLIFAAIAGFNYGGVLVLYASATAHRWGAERVGSIYGWLFSSNMPAGFTPTLAALIYDRTGSFTPSLVGLGVLLVLVSIMWTQSEAKLAPATA